MSKETIVLVAGFWVDIEDVQKLPFVCGGERGWEENERKLGLEGVNLSTT